MTHGHPCSLFAEISPAFRPAGREADTLPGHHRGPGFREIPRPRFVRCLRHLHRQLQHSVFPLFNDLGGDIHHSGIHGENQPAAEGRGLQGEPDHHPERSHRRSHLLPRAAPKFREPDGPPEIHQPAPALDPGRSPGTHQHGDFRHHRPLHP